MKILIAVDGSEAAEQMLDWACHLLNRESNRFYLLTVISDPMIAEYKVEEAQEVLRLARQKLEGAGLPVEKTEYLLGDPIQRICQAADDEDVDQILLGSHGRHGLAKTLLGSVSEGVLERCRRPVFIYRHHQDQVSRSRF